MNRGPRVWLGIACITVTVVTTLAWRISHPTNVKASSSALMLPWPAGVKHNIFGGYSYWQGDHTSIYYYAIDWNVVNAPVTAVLDGAAYTGHDTCGGYYVWMFMPEALAPTMGTSTVRRLISG